MEKIATRQNETGMALHPPILVSAATGQVCELNSLYFPAFYLLFAC
jgi:hypothetical protein